MNLTSMARTLICALSIGAAGLTGCAGSEGGGEADAAAAPVDGRVMPASAEAREAGIAYYHVSRDGDFAKTVAFDAGGRALATFKQRVEGDKTIDEIAFPGRTMRLERTVDDDGGLRVRGELEGAVFTTTGRLSDPSSFVTAGRLPALSELESALIVHGFAGQSRAADDAPYTYSCATCHLLALALSAGVVGCITVPGLGCVALPAAFAAYNEDCRNPDPCYTCSTPPFCF